MIFDFFKKKGPLLTNDKDKMLYPLVYNDDGGIYVIVNNYGKLYPPPYYHAGKPFRSTSIEKFADYVFNDGFTIDLLQFRTPRKILKMARAKTLGGKNLRKFNILEIQHYNHELKKIREKTGMQNTYDPTPEDLELATA